MPETKISQRVSRLEETVARLESVIVSDVAPDTAAEVDLSDPAVFDTPAEATPAPAPAVKRRGA